MEEISINTVEDQMYSEQAALFGIDTEKNSDLLWSSKLNLKQLIKLVKCDHFLFVKQSESQTN